LQQAKKRDHKVLITDTAIEKVSYVQIPGLTRHQCELLQAAQRDTLKLAMLENVSNEVAIAFNLETGERAVVFGDVDNVDVEHSIDMRALKDSSYAMELALIHNHPSTSNFSFADIDYFLADDYMGLMAVITNQGESYVLYKKRNYDFDKLQTIKRHLMREYSLNRQDLIVKEFLKCCSAGGVGYVKGN